MSATISFDVNVRKENGKGVARKLRSAGRVPGVLYGKGVEPLSVSLDRHNFINTVKGHSISNTFMQLNIEGGETAQVLVREIQLDPVSNEVLHVDFNRISMTEKLEMEIPIELIGTPTGVKNQGGILEHSVRALTVRCLPTEAPDSIQIDIADLELGKKMHVSELPEGDYEMVSDPETVVASVVAPKAEAEPEAEEETEEGAEPEVVGKEGAEEDQEAEKDKE